MDLVALQKRMEGCPCGKKHVCDLKALEVAHGNLARTGELLKKYNFPTHILLVADKNSFMVTSGLTESLLKEGFLVQMRVYDDMKIARMEEVEEIKAMCANIDGVLSVGTGSVNDICRYGSFLAGKPLAIFATAPSMDGFASDSAPIIINGFKITCQCHQPQIIIADSEILAESPAELKAAGFGDMMAKFIAIADWRIANLVHGDYYCERVAEMVREATAKIVALSGEISGHSEKAVEAVMEALALTGIAMQYVKLSRPASGTEHIISHYWECKKLERGVYSDFHGKKVGVATLIVADVYHKVAKMKGIKAHAEHADWADIYKTYGPNLSVDVKRLNEPCITDEINPDDITKNWDKICKIIEEEIPPVDKLLEYYKAAGAVTTIEQIKVDKQLCDEGLKYHPYMRKRITLARIMPMCDLDFVKIYYSDKK